MAQSRDLQMARRFTGMSGPFPTVAEAEAHLWTEYERTVVEQARDRTFVGAPEQVRERLEALAATYEADELVVVTITEDERTRLRSYELLAEVFDLPDEGTGDRGQATGMSPSSL